MMKYFLSVFSVLLLVSSIGIVCYDGGKSEKRALGIISAFIILSPIISAIGNLNLSYIPEFNMTDSLPDEDCSTVIEEAFAEGIVTAISDEFLLKEENIRVKIKNFNMNEMKCEEIKIILTGSNVIADRRGVEKYVNSLGVGECSVEIEI